MSPAPILQLLEVSKRFGPLAAVDRVSLDVRPNELFALLGPSGCGKTMLLRLLAGFERPSEGRILIDGADMAAVPPNRRPVNLVFQSYAVFPHMTVAENVGYGLKVEGVPRRQIEARVEAALAMVRLAGFEARRPEQLSGGQRQRVALARALIKRPKVLLLDEPLSALDRKLRAEMQLELVRLQHEVGITFLIVTHDQEEALSMADRIAVMFDGRILQVAPPEELYEQPRCRRVADFIGTMNLLHGRVLAPVDGRLRIAAEGLGEIALPVAGGASGEVEVAIRPEKVRLSREPPGDGLIAARGRIDQIAYFGDASHIYVRTEGDLRITCNRPNRRRVEEAPLAVGEPCWVSWRPADCILLVE